MPPPPPSPATWDRLFSPLSFFARNVSGGLWLFTQCPSPPPGQEPLTAERQLSDTAGLHKDLTRAERRDDGLLSSGVGGGSEQCHCHWNKRFLHHEGQEEQG